MDHYAMIVNGEPLDSEKRGEVINPATGKPFATCALGDRGAVDRAVAAARQAFASWGSSPDETRRDACQALAACIEENMPELMRLVTLESGKPQAGLNGIGAGMEVGGAAAWTGYTAGLSLPVQTIQDNEEARIEVRYKPLGVVASITPWNWPLLIAVWHVVPALRAGNTVVIKPSPFTPVSTLRFIELAQSVLPPGVLNAVTGEGEVGEALTSHPDVAKIVFTGSTRTGRNIMRSASDTLKRLTLELGGNDQGIVLPDTDLEKMLPRIFGACFHNNGQTCTALKRLYVHESQYDAACEGLAALARDVRVDDGMAEGAELGPLQNANQLRIVEELAASARDDGGRFLCGGERLDRDGYFYAPTVVAGLSDGSRLVDEEPFGPILPVISYGDVGEALERSNMNPAGLGGSIWSSNVDAAVDLAASLQCGTAWVNDHCSIQPDMPFGGVKQSGFGVEFGLPGLKEFTALQSIKVVH